MLIDTDIFKTEKEIAELFNKSQQSVSRSIKRIAAKGKPVTALHKFGTIIYDIRTLPDTITKGAKEESEANQAQPGPGKKETKQPGKKDK